MSEQDVNKLPKWAQFYIANLESQIAGLKVQIRQMDAEGSRVSWEVGISDKHGLPDRANIEMVLDNGDVLSFRHAGSYVYLSNDTPSNQLVVAPWVGNVIHILTIQEQ